MTLPPPPAVAALPLPQFDGLPDHMQAGMDVLNSFRQDHQVRWLTSVVASARAFAGRMRAAWQRPHPAHNIRHAGLLMKVSSLSWDASLAQDASILASSCPTSNPQGQPYVMGYNYADLTEAVNGWYSKKHSYDFDSPSFQPNAWQFTMLIWKGSTRIGCASQQCSDWSVSVCKFDPPGAHTAMACIGTAGATPRCSPLLAPALPRSTP